MVGLVGANILRDIRSVESDVLQRTVERGLERSDVAVCQRYQLVVFLELGQGSHGVGEGGPFADGDADGVGFIC